MTASSNGIGSVTPTAATTPTGGGNKATATDAVGQSRGSVGGGEGLGAGAAQVGSAAVPAVKRDPRNDDDAQSSYCVGTVETSSRSERCMWLWMAREGGGMG